ncbi:uncharacterized protein LOC132281835 [Cornus florida]|uniref:uncharacterized protein LOC132281835 n=1 Tax=Cornus florida TaxID=4283 RepID=UPI00289DF25D|nr:uncharacterized protein LOC132281835 [Cornus florida]
MAEETVDTPVTAETVDTPVTAETVDIPVTGETVDAPVTVETIDIPITVETVAIPPLKKIQLEDGHGRRNLTGDVGMLFNGIRILPRYLTGSPGSCHDFCKYGTKHESETKPMSPKPKRIIARPSEGEYLAKTVNSVPRKKKSVSSPNKKSTISPKPLPDSNSQIPDKKQVTKKEVPASAKKAAVSSKHVSSPRKGMEVSTKVASDVKPKRLLMKSSSLPNPRHLSNRRDGEIIIPKRTESLKMSPLGVSSNRRKSNIGENNKVQSPKTRKKNNLMQQTVPLFPKSTVKRVVLRQNSEDYTNLRKVALLKNQQCERKAEPEEPNDETVLEKTLYVIETKPDKLTMELAQSDSEVAHSSPSLSPSSEDESLGFDQNGTRASLSPPSSEDKISGQTQTGICTTQPSSRSSPSSENRRLRRTRSAIHNTRSSSLSLLSLPLSASESLKTKEVGLISEHIESKKVEKKSRSRRVGRVGSEDRDRSPRKLNFRRAKLVDVNHENNDPRKLRFRQGKALGENQNGKADTKRRILRRSISDVKPIATKAETVEVVLRHQDVEDKKDVQNLFNEVIEETASKLLRDRNSKVKSLVGAFETVISLQDTKSAATAKTN